MTDSVKDQGIFADGAAYEQSMGRWSKRVGEQFVSWLNLPTGLEWLDAGCGNGAFTEVICRTCSPKEIAGIDPSKAQIDYAAARPGCTQVKFGVGNVLDLNFADNTFDVAVMGLVISFLSDPYKAVDELTRVTRPNGCVATYMWDGDTAGHPSHPMNRSLDALSIPRGRAPNIPISKMENLREVWSRAGLSAVETKPIEITIEYEDFEECWNTIVNSTGPLGKSLRELPTEKKERLASQLRDELPSDASGKISYAARANAIKGIVPR